MTNSWEFIFIASTIEEQIEVIRHDTTENEGAVNETDHLSLCRTLAGGC